MINEFNIKYFALTNDEIKQKVKDKAIFEYYLKKSKEKKDTINIAKQRELKYNFNN